MRRNIRIGVTGPAKGERLFWWATQLGLWLAGAKAQHITPLRCRTQDIQSCDGFIISGGADINPQLYGEAAVAIAMQYDAPRDAMEQSIIRHALKMNKPLLGICRGMQLLNVTLGGSLYQEASEVLEGFLPNKSLLGKFLGRRLVCIEASSQLFALLGANGCYHVNSIHHQAVNRLGTGLSVSAKEENGLVQALEWCDGEQHSAIEHFVIGVQWHPELMLHCCHARRLFAQLVSACQRRA